MDEEKKNSWGGYREGAGRPKGSMNAETLERKRAGEEYRLRIAEHAEHLFNAQFSLAVGTQLLFRVDHDEKGSPKPAVQVTDEKEIKQFIDELGAQDGEMNGSSYYFIAAQKPDNKAIKDMLDRSFGKAKENIDITSGDKPIQQPVIISAITPRHVATEAEAASGN